MFYIRYEKIWKYVFVNAVEEERKSICVHTYFFFFLSGTNGLLKDLPATEIL